MSDDTDDVTAGEPVGGAAPTSVRLTAARARVADATAALADARAASDVVRARRDDRRARLHPVVTLAAAVLAVALIATSIVMVVMDRSHRADAARAEAVVDAARGAITTVLTADPEQPTRYVESVLAVSTGEFGTRISRAAAEIESSVAAQSLPGTGQVISAGIVGADPGSSAQVLLVAEATNPQLLGGDAGDERVVLLVRMTRVDGAWKIAQADLR